MKKMAGVIMYMADTMRRIPHSSYLSVKELLSSPSWKYMHECPERKHTQEPPRIVMDRKFDYKEHFHIAGECMTNKGVLRHMTLQAWANQHTSVREEGTQTTPTNCLYSHLDH